MDNGKWVIIVMDNRLFYTFVKHKCVKPFLGYWYLSSTLQLKMGCFTHLFLQCSILTFPWPEFKKSNSLVYVL